MHCPLCAAAIPAEQTKCPGCGADLSDYLNAGYQPDLLFNEALDLLKRESYSEACTILCRAHTLRPQDAGILDLWVRAEYYSGNKKRALELMTDLVELDDSEARMEQLTLLVGEFDREQADTGVVIKRELQEQNDRLRGLLDRLEDRLDEMEGGCPSSGQAAAPSSTGADPSGGSLSGSPEVTAPSEPSGGKDPGSFISGGFPDFSQFSGMFPPGDENK